jgi:hypothetical protein
MESQDLVTLCTVNSPTEAELIRSALQAVGLTCEIGGEGQAGFAGVFSIDIMTKADELTEARKYLKKLQREKVERKKKRVAARKAKAEGTSEAIQELPKGKKPPK